MSKKWYQDNTTMGGLGGAALGLADYLNEKSQVDAQREVEMAKARWGMLANGGQGQWASEFIHNPDILGKLSTGALQGGKQGAKYDEYLAEQKAMQEKEAASTQAQAKALQPELEQTFQALNGPTEAIAGSPTPAGPAPAKAPPIGPAGPPPAQTIKGFGPINNGDEYARGLEHRKKLALEEQRNAIRNSTGHDAQAFGELPPTPWGRLQGGRGGF